MSLQLQRLWHLVELVPTEKNRTTASGIALPDTYWGRQDSTALVMASGPGLELPGGAVLPPMVQPGDLVLLDSGDFRELQDTERRQGFVWETALVAWLACGERETEDRPVPLNEWCLIRLDERPKQAGIVALSDKAERPRSGIIEEVGPGRLVTRGESAGRRLACEAICGCDLVGRRAHWGADVEIMCAGRYRLTWVLVRASDLMAVEWERAVATVGNVRLMPIERFLAGAG